MDTAPLHRPGVPPVGADTVNGDNGTRMPAHSGGARSGAPHGPRLKSATATVPPGALSRSSENAALPAYGSLGSTCCMVAHAGQAPAVQFDPLDVSVFASTSRPMYDS